MEKKLRKQRRIVELVRSDQAWQGTRSMLVGQWVRNPGLNLQLIKAYLWLRDFDEPSCQIVLNYLTSSGFRSGTITRNGGPTVAEIAILRKVVSAKLSELYKVKSIQMMPTHEHIACDGFGCADCKFAGIIPGKDGLKDRI